MDKKLLDLLPTVKLAKPEPRKIIYDTSAEDAYLASLSEDERRRYKLKQYMNKLSKRGMKKVFPDDPKLKMPKPIKYVVTVFTEPFPMMSPYREGDMEEFEGLKPVVFEKFLEGRRFYMRLLLGYVSKERKKKRLSHYE